MSVLSDILERLTALTNWKNSVVANSKTTGELDAQGTLNTSSLIRVSIGGVSQFITVQQIVDAATLSTNNVGTNGIVSGTIEYVSGLTYRTLNLVYRINNVLYYSNGFSIILNAGGTLKRTDVIYGDAELDGQILVLEGAEATVPIKPIVQWGYQLELTFATIATSATTPEGVSEFTLYDENLQLVGGEYNTVTNTPLQVDLANTTLFNTGAKSIKFINAGTVGFNLTSTVKKDGANISFVKFRVYLTDANKSHRLQLSFWVNNTLRTGDITVTHGMFNFDSYLINTWQTIVIPGAAFAVNGVWGAYQYDDLYFQNRRSGCTFYVDTITIQEGVTTQNNTSNHTHANYSILEQITQALLNAWNSASTWVTTNGANVLFKADALTAVTPTNKIITQADVTSFGGGDMLAINNLSEVDPATARTNLGIATAKTKTDFLTITQAVDLDDIEIRVNNLDAAVVLKGAWDASAGTFPGAGIAQAGFSYQVTVAGTVNGIDFSINDRIIALVDNASTTVYATNWLKADYSDLVASFNGRTGAIVLLNTDISDLMVASTAKTTLVDTDIFSLFDTVLKKVTWANIKAELKTYFDTLYATVAMAKMEYATLACSDEENPLTLGQRIAFRQLFLYTLSEVRISSNEAPTITKLIVDVKVNGVSIFSTLISIDTGETTSFTASVPAVISNPTIPDNAIVTVFVTQLGSGDIGDGLKISFIGQRA